VLEVVATTAFLGFQVGRSITSTPDEEVSKNTDKAQLQLGNIFWLKQITPLLMNKWPAINLDKFDGISTIDNRFFTIGPIEKQYKVVENIQTSPF